jgi:hypothetical protein
MNVDISFARHMKYLNINIKNDIFILRLHSSNLIVNLNDCDIASIFKEI